ncbi:putative helicase [Pseudomonas phage MR14]|nr:putative helicase [Pseudomonas phage MR14]
MPTGAGKTVFFASLISEHEGASCCIAHRSELIEQISMALARFGVRHRIIGPDKLIRAICKQHLDETGICWYDPTARAAVASVQSLTPSRVKAEARWIAQCTLWVQDECFPAGTLVDGKPIEQLQIGDTVTAFDERDGSTCLRKVARLWKNPAPQDMIRLEAAHHVVECTYAHPIFTRRGWVAAGDLLRTDEVLLDEMYDVRNLHPLPDRAPGSTIQQTGSSLLLEDLRSSLLRRNLEGHNGRDQSEVCVSPNEVEQPHGKTGFTPENEGYPDADETRPVSSGRQWAAPDCCGSTAVPNTRGPGLSAAVQHPNGFCDMPIGVPGGVQAGLGQSSIAGGDRSRRGQPLDDSATGSGPEKRHVLNWSRLDSVEVFQCRNSDGTYKGSHDGFVYNIEVEDLHTYIANGVVVHNCHHVLRENQWGKAALLFPNAKGLGVTATPVRADGKGLGRHASGVFDVMVKGPSMRDLIDWGYLTQYRVIVSETHIDLAGVSVGTDGDYVLDRGKGKAAVRGSTLVGDVVSTYQKYALGKQAVVFASDTETSEDMAARFREAGIVAEHVDGMTDPDERRRIMQRFRSKQTQVLSNVGLVSEGFDVPGIEVVILAAKTISFSKHAQQVGRALRLLIERGLMLQWDDYSVPERLAHIAASEKPKALVIDHVGSFLDPRLGLPDAKNDWTLDDQERKSSGPTDAIPLVACMSCASPFERFHKACPYCGSVRQPTPGRSGPESVDGDMTELPEAMLAALRAAVASVAMPNDVYREQAHLRGLPSAWVGSNVKKHDAHRVALLGLQEAMSWWGGEHRAQGRSDSEIFRRWFLMFGTDWLTAQAQDRATMEKLTLQVIERLTPASTLAMMTNMAG